MQGRLSKDRPITFVLPTLTGGGAEIVVILLVKELSRLGYSCDLFLFRDRRDYSLDKDLSIKVRGLSSSGTVLSLIYFLVFLVFTKRRTIWSHVAPLGMLTASLAAIVGHISLYTEHSEISYSSRRFNFWKAYKWLFKVMLSKIKLYTVSPGNARDFENYFGLARLSVQVCPNPVRIVSRIPIRSSRVVEDRINIGIVGSAKKVKRLDIVASIIKDLEQINLSRRFVFHFFGSGNAILSYLPSHLENKMVEVHCKEFTEDINMVYGNIDVLLNTSESESFGNVFVEALSAGCYVVATKTSGSNYVLESDLMGKISVTNDSSELTRILTTIDIKRIFSQRSIENRINYASGFSVDKIIKNYA